MRVAVTGATGRLGRALVAALAEAPVHRAGRPDRLDPRRLRPRRARPASTTLLDRDRPEVVVHAAAWTDVDGCARDPELAMRRNGEATGVLARPAPRAASTCGRVDQRGLRRHADRRRGYAPDDRVAPGNPTALEARPASAAATDAYTAPAREPARRSSGRPGCSGRPGATSRARSSPPPTGPRAAGEPLRVVGDEWGTPTYAADVAEAIVELLGRDAIGGIHHVVNGGRRVARRWARDVFGTGSAIESRSRRCPASTWQRASTPPRWGVLAPTPLPPASRSAPGRQAMADYAPILRASRRQPAGPMSLGPRRRPRCPASASARSRATATSAARSASCGGRTRSARSTPRTRARRRARRPPVRPGQPLDVGRRRAARAPPPSAPARLLGRGHRPGVRRARRRPADARRRARAARVETRELGADDWVVIPTGVAHGFLALEPLELLYLVTNEYDGTRRARLRLGRPLAAVPWPPVARIARRPADPVGPRPHRIRRLIGAGRAPAFRGLTGPGPPRTRPHRPTGTAHRPGRRANSAGTIPRLSRRAIQPATL